MKAIDMHAHFGAIDRQAGGLLFNPQMHSGGIELVCRRAEAVGIRLTVVSALHALFPYGGDVLGGNKDACKVAEKHSDG